MCKLPDCIFRVYRPEFPHHHLNTPSLPPSLFNEKLLETFTAPKSENREEGVISITIPESWLIADVHFWLFLRSQNLKDKSDSIYIKLIDDIAYFDGLAVLNKYLSKGLIHQYRQQLL